jgi:ribosomal protein L7/L12
LNEPGQALPPTVIAALRRDNAIEAIRLLRAASGVGLEEAKAAIEAYRQNAPATGFDAAPRAPASMPAAVVEALQNGNKIEAIRRLREHVDNMSLKDAKDAIEGFRVARMNQAPSTSFNTAAGLSPGQVAPSHGRWLWIVAVVIAAALAFAYLGR